MEERIRAVVYLEEGHCVAQCLEYDIRVEATSLSDLMDSLAIVIDETYKDSMDRHGKPFAYVDPAPDIFQQMWHERAAAISPIKEPLPNQALPAYWGLDLAVA